MDRSHLPLAVWSHVPDVTAVIGADGAVLWAAGPTERMLGLSADATAVMSLFDWLSPDDVDRVGQALQNAAASGSPAHVECRLRHRQGGWIVAELAAAAGLHPLGEGGAPTLVVSLRELGESRRVDSIIEGVVRGRPLAQSLSEIAELVESPIDRCGCAIYVVNPADEGADMVATSGRLTWVVPELRSRRWLAELGPVGQAIVDRHPVAARPGGQWGVDPVTSVANHLGADVAVALPFGETFAGRIAAGCLLIIGPSEQINQLNGELVERWLSAASLAVDHHQRWEALTTVAGSDPVTGLVNRAGILNALGDRLTRRPDGIAVLVLAVDGLAQLRARDGYVAGDQGLRSVAERLVRSAEPGDLVGRLDGDDLVVLLTASTPIAAREQVAYLIRCCEELHPGVDLSPRAGLVWAQAGRGMPEDHVALAASEAYASPAHRAAEATPATPASGEAREGIFGATLPVNVNGSERLDLAGLSNRVPRPAPSRGLRSEVSTARIERVSLSPKISTDVDTGLRTDGGAELTPAGASNAGVRPSLEPGEAEAPIPATFESSRAQPTTPFVNRAALLSAAARRATADRSAGVAPVVPGPKDDNAATSSCPPSQHVGEAVSAERGDVAVLAHVDVELERSNMADGEGPDNLGGRPGGARLRDWFRGGAR